MRTVVIGGTITEVQARRIVEEGNVVLTGKGSLYRLEVGRHVAGAGGIDFGLIVSIGALVLQTLGFLLDAWDRWGKSTADSGDPEFREVQVLYDSHGNAELVRADSLGSFLRDGAGQCRLVANAPCDGTRVVLLIEGTMDHISIFIEC